MASAASGSTSRTFRRVGRKVPSSLGVAGGLRNWVLDRYEYWGGIPPSEADAPGSAYLMERLCNGIGQAVQDATRAAVRSGRLDGKLFRDLGTHPMFYASPLEMRRNDTFFGHYANLVRPAGANPNIVATDCYVLDWWMTLDVHNPMVWNYEDWRNYPWNQGGVPYDRYVGAAVVPPMPAFQLVPGRDF